MRRALLLAVAVAFAVSAGGARGGGTTFAIVPDSFGPAAAGTQNLAGLALAPSWLTPPAQPVQLSSAQLLDLWRSAGQAYGVPWSVLAAINKVESDFGRNMGPSSAGAIGWMQFMPSTWVEWGTDANGDGVADPWNPVDAIYSAARYLAASGAATDIRQAVFSYNHSWSYVDEVMQLAQLYGGSGAPATGGQTVFALDQLQTQLAGARAAVAQASETYDAARARAEELASRAQALVQGADSPALLSDQLEAQKNATQAAAVAQARADELEGELNAAQGRLSQLQAGAQAASFNHPAGQMFGAPQATGSYVFPVGGGAAVVSVSHFHHDYPAADIDAPEGSPVYALSDGTVLSAWSADPRCGIGFTIQATDGQTWTYCHLSYLEPAVTDGAQLSVGELVGLVGQTGDATGPHLHLQLQPATAYPQDEQWFQSFAGTAFQWSDAAATAAPAPSAPLVFHIVSG